MSEKEGVMPAASGHSGSLFRVDECPESATLVICALESLVYRRAYSPGSATRLFPNLNRANQCGPTGLPETIEN